MQPVFYDKVRFQPLQFGGIMSPQVESALKNLDDQIFLRRSEEFFASADYVARRELAEEAIKSTQLSKPRAPLALMAGTFLGGMIAFGTLDLIRLATHERPVFLLPGLVSACLSSPLSVALVLALSQRPAARCRTAIGLVGGAWAASLSVELLDRIPHPWFCRRGETPETIRAELLTNIDNNMALLKDHPEELSEGAKKVLRKWASKPDSLEPWKQDLLDKFSWVAR